MEKKTGLNNVQRKMLDEIYSEQFEKKKGAILGKREVEYKILADKVLAEEAKKAPLKEMLTAISVAFKLTEKNSEYMKLHGLNLDNRVYENKLEINTYGSYNHPSLEKHKVETRRIDQELAEKKKEMRARIYGMDTTYTEVEKEIGRLIAGIKI